MQPIFIIQDLEKRYEGKYVLKIEELSIVSGECFGLVGNNGAGKTTLFRLLLDLIRANRGAVYSKEKLVAGSEHWKAYTGAWLDENFLIPFLTPVEYFGFTAKLHDWSERQLFDFLSLYHEFFNMEAFGNKLIRDLSAGNKSKVGILAAMIGHPEVLILDEPFATIDPGSQIRLKNILADLQAQRQVTILISSHDLRHVTDICQRIVVLHNGQIARDLRTDSTTLQELEEWFKA